MHSAGLELTKLTYTRLEDNLIRHRGDRQATYVPSGTKRWLGTMELERNLFGVHWRRMTRSPNRSVSQGRKEKITLKYSRPWSPNKVGKTKAA